MKQLDSLEKWLSEYLPEVLDDLRPGASLEMVQQLESAIGVRLPDSFKNLYLWHDGQNMSTRTGPWYGLRFLPVNRIQKEYEMWQQVLRDSSEESLISLNAIMKSTPQQFVKREYANLKWIPFAYDNGGNYLGIDLDPDIQGTVGQVINFGRDEERKIAIADSLESYLDWMLQKLVDGNFIVTLEADGGRSFNTSNPQKAHFLDSLAIMFPEKN
jgi:cell wall assembly regulator SMI1